MVQWCNAHGSGALAKGKQLLEVVIGVCETILVLKIAYRSCMPFSWCCYLCARTFGHVAIFFILALMI